MDARTQRQIAANEARFREMNEQHANAAEEFHPVIAGPLTIMCECALDGCEDSIELMSDEYRQIRLDPTHFIVRPDHIVAEAEQIVEDRRTFWIVAKVAEGAEVSRERA